MTGIETGGTVKTNLFNLFNIWEMYFLIFTYN
jgi:hypothetical protein